MLPPNRPQATLKTVASAVSVATPVSPTWTDSTKPLTTYKPSLWQTKWNPTRILPATRWSPPSQFSSRSTLSQPAATPPVTWGQLPTTRAATAKRNSVWEGEARNSTQTSGK